MSEKIRLTKKQVLFLQEWVEEKDPEKAAEIFMGWMLDERVDPQDIAIMIDKIMKRIEKK